MAREKLSIGKDGMLTYRYKANKYMSFKFHTMNEVGEPFQLWFKQEIERRGLRVETRFLGDKPYVADFVARRTLWA